MHNESYFLVATLSPVLVIGKSLEFNNHKQEVGKVEWHPAEPSLFSWETMNTTFLSSKSEHSLRAERRAALCWLLLTSPWGTVTPHPCGQVIVSRQSSIYSNIIVSNGKSAKATSKSVLVGGNTLILAKRPLTKRPLFIEWLPSTQETLQHVRHHSRNSYLWFKRCSL